MASHKLPGIRPHPLNKIFSPSTPLEAIDLITKLLNFIPEQRIKPIEALQHPFFDDIRKKDTRLPNGLALSDNLFAFSLEEILECTD